MPSTTNKLTLTKSKTKRTKPQGGRAPKLVRSKSVAAAAAKVPKMATIAPSMIPNTSILTMPTTMMPVMMALPSTESDMKMLEELYVSVCGQDGVLRSFLAKSGIEWSTSSEIWRPYTPRANPIS